MAAFGPKNWDRILKFGLQLLIVVIFKEYEENLRLDIIDLHFYLHINSENTGKYYFFSFEFNYLKLIRHDFKFLLPHKSCNDIDIFIHHPVWPSWKGQNIKLMKISQVRYQIIGFSCSDSILIRYLQNFGRNRKCWLNLPPEILVRKKSAGKDIHYLHKIHFVILPYMDQKENQNMSEINTPLKKSAKWHLISIFTLCLGVFFLNTLHMSLQPRKVRSC